MPSRTPYFDQLPPLTLYIHIPWCARKCPYCDFNSHNAPDALPEAGYIHALLADLDADLAYVQNRPLQSIFFGGGTPSLFSAQAIETLLKAIAQRLSFAPDIEITLEANPGTLEQGKFAALRQAGINRLSIGVQSFNDQHLQLLGRIHSSNEAKRAIAAAQQAGFDSFNLDLMFALPQQSIDQALADLETALAFEPPHVSWYQLTLEPNTVFFNNPPPLPSDDNSADMQQLGQQLLASRGYQQYEVSAYSQPGQTCRHNLNYWLFGDYLGIGAGAHGKITLLNPAEPNGRLLRTRKTRLPRDYMSSHGSRPNLQAVAVQEITGEFMMNALRLNAGFSTTDFTRRTGLPLDCLQPALQQACHQNLLHIAADGTHIQPTAKGRLFLNDLMTLFL